MNTQDEAKYASQTKQFVPVNDIWDLTLCDGRKHSCNLLILNVLSDGLV